MKTPKLAIVNLFLFLMLGAFSVYEYYIIQQQNIKIDNLTTFKESSEKKMDSMKTILKQTDEQLDDHDERLEYLEKDMESIYKWSENVVRWSRQF